MGSATYQEEKDLALKVWRWFRDHPYLKRTKELPMSLRKRLDEYDDGDPVCAIFSHFCTSGARHNCPLRGCMDTDGFYAMWFRAETDVERGKVASAIVLCLEAWDGEV